MNSGYKSITNKFKHYHNTLYVCSIYAWVIYVLCIIHVIYSRFLGNQVLRHVSLSGVADAFEKHKEKAQKGIKAHFRMDESGILNLDSVSKPFMHKIQHSTSYKWLHTPSIRKNF